MSLPSALQQAIEDELERFGWHEIKEARENLTSRYRSRSLADKQGHFMVQEADRCAYLAARMPATYAVNEAVLEEIKRLMPQVSIHSLLDLGAGPGTAMWAASSVYPSLQQMTLIEKDEALISFGKRLAAKSEREALKKAEWVSQDLSQIETLGMHDLVILSYSIGELSEAARFALLHASWQAAKQCLIIIEPGTPVGFERIRQLRSELIGIGAHLVAPCPHHLACPMAGGDWCHFAKRIERSSIHRRIKGGTLGYEDEKYSYIIASKQSCELPKSRILRDPMKRSGHVCLTLCTPKGLIQQTVSKRHLEAYKQAKKGEWGSPFDYFPL